MTSASGRWLVVVSVLLGAGPTFGVASETADPATSPEPGSGTRPPEVEAPESAEPAQTAGPGPEVARPAPAEEPVDRRLVLPIFGLHFSNVQGTSGVLGVGLGREKPGDEWRGLVAIVEPGKSGLKLQAGVAKIWSSYAGVYARASWFRSWRRSEDLPPDQDYAGAELELMLLGFNATIGLYRHVAGSEPAPAWLTSFGFGLWH